MRRLIAAFVFCLVLTPAYAQRQEPVGCDKFKWPLDSERALLRAPDAAKIASGAEIAVPTTKAATIKLDPFTDAKLPMAPERAPRSTDSKAGFVKVVAPAQAGRYHITLSAGGWIDVIQDGRFTKSGDASGVEGCEGIRKSVTFDLAATPFIVQFTGVTPDTIGMVMTPVKP